MTVTLSKGDVVKVTRTLEVLDDLPWTFIMGNGEKVRGARTKDVHSGREYIVEQTGSAVVLMVKKAKRQRQQFTVGQVVTSDTLREVMWVRGTVIERADERQAAFVLREDGKWHDLLGPDRDCECQSGWSFTAFAGDYRLVRLPGQ